MRTFTTALFALLTAFASVAQAQDLPIRVGRVAHIEGRVSLYQDPESGWEKAYVNSPITSENSVWADDGSRAEVRISGMAIRVDRLTQLDVAKLDEDELDAFVARGSVALRVRHYENNERLTFNTPNTRVRIRANGRYRIDVDPERLETRVTVFAGEARVGTDDGRMRIAAGRSVVIFGADPPEFFEEAARSDPFDRWTLARDERWREGRAPTYVSTYMTGYEDLDGYGRWATEPDYGTLWYPTNVANDWAPYRHGRWDYVRPWGWTWIDDAPWGYAPFHYGRWVYVRDRWAWHPGERVARPVWAPALVAWIGGANFNVGVSTGSPSVGWYPLSPWDRYEPWYQASPAYLNRVNIVVRSEPARQDRREWHRWTRERGTTVVDRRALVNSQSVRQARITVAPEVARQVQVARPEAVLPSRADVLQRRREQPQQASAPVAQAPARAPTGAASQAPPGRSAIVRPDFGRNAVAVTPRAATQESRQAQRENRGQGREQQQAQERAAREVQQQGQQQSQQQRQAQERAQREQQQAQEKAAREAQQQQQQQSQQQRQAQERAQREQQQAQEKAAREAQQQQQQQSQQQRQAQERAQREQQQAQEKAAREAQQQQQQQSQQQRQAQERAQREQQQAQEKAAREAQQKQQQQQQQQQAQEKAAREAQQKQQQQQQAQEKAAREAQQKQQQQQQQQQAQEKAAREAQQKQQQQQQAQEKAAREAQQRAAQQQQQLQAQERAAREAQQAQEKAAREAQQAAQRAAQGQGQAKGRSQKEKEEEEEKEKGKGKGKQ